MAEPVPTGEVEERPGQALAPAGRVGLHRWNRATPGNAEKRPIWHTSRPSRKAPNHWPCPAPTMRRRACTPAVE